MGDFWGSFGKARDRARKNHYKCLYPGCSKITCDCHLVQQHPFVASIAEDGRVYQKIRGRFFDPFCRKTRGQEFSYNKSESEVDCE